MMKRISTLTMMLCFVAGAVVAQFLPPTKDVYKKHTQAGIVSEVAPYSTGFVYISNNGTNDVISYTTDGISFTDAESLENGTAKSLAGWTGSDIAFYLGDNATDAVGIELRKLDAGVPSFIYDHNPLGDANQKLLTGVDRFHNGTAFEYHYLYQSGADMFGGAIATHNITTGADGDSPIEIAPAEFSIQDASLFNYKMFGAGFNGNYYYAAKNATMFGGYAALYKAVDGNVEMVHKLDVDIASIYGVTATSNHLYFLSGNYGDLGDATLFVTDQDDNTNVVKSNSMDVMIDDAMDLQILNDKLYCIAQFGTGHKLAEITGTNVKFFHLNAEDETDNITEMIISGDYIYVIASETGQEPQLYAINPSRGDAAFVTAIDATAGYSYNFSMLTAINGGVAFLDNDGSTDKICVSDGNDGNTKALMVDGNLPLTINKLHSTGDKIYAFASNGTDTDIYEYVVAAFTTQVEEVTITEFDSGTAIEGAMVTFDTGLEVFTSNTNASGIVTFNNVPKGYLDVKVMKDGYANVEDVYYVGGMFPASYELTPAKNFAFTIFDKSVYDPAYVGPGSNGALEGVTVELSDGSNTYSSMSTMEGFADFNGVHYGNYDYTVSMSGFVTTTGTFDVDASTLGGLRVLLEPVPTSIKDKEQNMVKIYPNPASDIININADQAILSLDIFSITGAKVLSLSGEDITTIDISNLSKGLYMVVVNDISRNTHVIKINKN